MSSIVPPKWTVAALEHEFQCFVSSYFTSSLGVFLMSPKTCLRASSR
jgi:hypothetical protein